MTTPATEPPIIAAVGATGVPEVAGTGIADGVGINTYEVVVVLKSLTIAARLAASLNTISGSPIFRELTCLRGRARLRTSITASREGCWYQRYSD
jgi:hypothetical protein